MRRGDMTFWRKYLLAISACALAATPVAAEQPMASAFVRCDGKPNKPTELGTIARLVAITAIVGLLLPEREAADPSKREAGLDGVRACDEALNGAEKASDGGRRIELILGRSIHQMELSNWDAAIDDIHSVASDQPELVATPTYHESLGLTAMSLEAMALVGKGDYPAASKLAEAMAERAPYNMLNQLRAVDYVRLSPGWDEAKERYFDDYVRVYPNGLADRASQEARAGKFAAAARDFGALAHMSKSIPISIAYGQVAKRAIAVYLSGNTEQGHSLIAQASAAARADSKNQKGADSRAVVSEAEDYFAILDRLEKGDISIARTMFSARSKWSALPVGFPAELARRLNQASSEEQRSQIPIRSAEELDNDEQQWSIALINDAGKDGIDRWSQFRIPYSDKAFKGFARNVWRTDKSKYISEKRNQDWDATFVDTARNGGNLPAAYALYLHCALVAKARGLDGFMMMPGQRLLFAHYVRLGNAGDERIVPEVLFDADKVIADLSPYIPRPEK